MTKESHAANSGYHLDQNKKQKSNAMQSAKDLL